MYLLNKERYVAGSSNSKSLLINSHSLLVAKDPYRESSNVSHLYLSRRNSAISFLVSSPLNAEDFGNSRSLIPDSRKSPRFLLAWPRKFFTAVLLSRDHRGTSFRRKSPPGMCLPFLGPRDSESSRDGIGSRREGNTRARRHRRERSAARVIVIGRRALASSTSLATAELYFDTDVATSSLRHRLS